MNVEQLESQAAKAAAAAEAAAAKAEAARQARERRVDAALLANTDRLWRERRLEVQATRDKALESYEQTIADPEATLDELWGAFLALRTASAACAAVIGHAAELMNRHRPMAPNHLGVERNYGEVNNDPYRHITFADVLTVVANNRANDGARAARAHEETTIAAAIAEAEQD